MKNIIEVIQEISAIMIIICLWSILISVCFECEIGIEISALSLLLFCLIGATAIVIDQIFFD